MYICCTRCRSQKQGSRKLIFVQVDFNTRRVRRVWDRKLDTIECIMQAQKHFYKAKSSGDKIYDITTQKTVALHAKAITTRNSQCKKSHSRTIITYTFEPHQNNQLYTERKKNAKCCTPKPRKITTILDTTPVDNSR